MQVSFDIYNTEAVNRLKEENPDILPTYSVDSDADQAYNKSQINGAIESAIIQGKSVDHIAEDLQNRLQSVNEASAKRTARTAITCSQNSGCLEGWKAARDKGVNVKKQWIASLDSRTRESHAELDQEIQELDDDFSNGLQYPGDPNGDPSEVYNCRCSMKGYLPDYDTDTEDEGERFARDPETGEAEYVSSSMSYSEWMKTKTSTEINVETSTEVIRLRKINLFSKSDPLYVETFSIEEEEGFTDVCIHGDNKSVQMEVNGKLKNFTAEEFAKYLKENGLYKGGDIRLAACSAGKGSNSFAQQLSKILGTRVKAADDDVYFIPEEGVYFIGSPYSNKGKWRIFNNGVEE